MKLEELTEENTGPWSNDEWIKWYSGNKEESTYSEFTIREARKSDLPEILNLVSQTNFECQPETATRSIVAVKNDKLIGYLEIENFHTHDTEFLRLVVIHPSYRKQGIGGAMVGYTISEGGRYQANVHVDNGNSLNLFKKLGFAFGNVTDGLVQVSYGC